MNIPKVKTHMSNSQRLYQISLKPEKTIIGLMSGTSLDGLDIGVFRISGSGLNTKLEVLDFMTPSYCSTYLDLVNSMFSKRQVDLQQVCLANAWLGKYHANLIDRALNQWGRLKSEIDLVASHGQTIFHAPKQLHGLAAFEHGTLQIGDGDQIAHRLGIITCSDFRQKSIAAGGEGAPLAAYGDYFLFTHPTENRILINIGGIANITLLPASEQHNTVLCSDVGPGNTIMDALVKSMPNELSFDNNAEIALKGQVSEPLLKALLDNPFCQQKMPKTIGPELFNLTYLANAQQHSDTHMLETADVLATLNLFSATLIANAVKQSTTESSAAHLYVSGGGFFNPLLMRNLRSLLPTTLISSSADIGIEPEMKEAALFAVLANECVSGSPLSQGTDSNFPAVRMGKISFPN